MLTLAALFGLALCLRTTGVMRGLSQSYVYHPDEPKQMVALEHYLHGRYVWYTDSPFCDGYPLALNHLDEWLMRPILAIRNVCTRHVVPGSPAPRVPDLLALYTWARALRVVYAMAVLLLAWQLARRLFDGRWAQGLVLLLLAIAPLPVVTAHFATGDVGVDLFTAAALLALATYAARPRAGWLVLAGVCVGVGFACKFQAALAAIAIVLFIAAEAVAQRRVGRAFRDGLLALGSGAIGAVLATPAFFINAHRTWKDIRINFEFIRKYDASDAVLALPFVEQLRRGLLVNAPQILGAVGWGVVLLALLGAGIAPLKWWAARRRGDGEEARRTAFTVALTAFPFVAVLISLGGKPEVQPFHFAYLQLPFVMAAAFALTTLALHRAAGRPAAILLALLCVAELGLKTQREQFFWGRADTLPHHQQLEASLFIGAPLDGGSGAVLKRVFLEPPGPSVFRNRPREVVSRHAPFWNALHVAPVPAVPWSLDEDWIFDNGPVLPRNDRMFAVPANSRAERQLVLYEPPGPVTCGVRSGDSPVQARLDVGGDVRTVRLPPHSQRLLEFQPRKWRACRASGNGTGDNWFVPVRVRTGTGAAWVTVMRDPRDAALFRLFGGESDQPPVWPADIPDAAVVRAVNGARFLEGDSTVYLTENQATRVAADLALPAGLYTLECDVRGDEAGTLTLHIGSGMKTVPGLDIRRELPFTAGAQMLRLSFAKSFAPYTVALSAISSTPAARVTGWRLRPDVEGTLAAWRHWHDHGERPDWLRPWPLGLAEEPAQARTVEALFDGRFRVTRLGLPAQVRRGAPCPMWFGATMEGPPSRAYDELLVFVHLRNQGRLVKALDARLREVLVAGSASAPVRFELPSDLAPGRYDLVVGIFNERTRLRLPIEGPSLSPIEKRKRYFQAGDLVVTE
jgi:hypothetical protein